MPSKTKRYFCSICGTGFSSIKRFSDHKCNISDAQIKALVALRDYPKAISDCTVGGLVSGSVAAALCRKGFAKEMQMRMPQAGTGWIGWRQMVEITDKGLQVLMKVKV